MIGNLLKFIKALNAFKNKYGLQTSVLNGILNAKSGEDLIRAINETSPCVVNVTTQTVNKLTLNNTVSLNATVKNLLESIRVNCFEYQDEGNCQSDDMEAWTRGVMFLLSITLLFILSFAVYKREKACLSCCWGFPGPIVPVNLLDSYRNRHGYMLAFGITVTASLNVLLGSYEGIVGTSFADILKRQPSYVSIFIRISMAIFISLISYPIFVAQNVRNCLIGSLVGLTYTTLWLAMEFTKFGILRSTCWAYFQKTNNRQLITFQILGVLPKLCCLIALAVRFSFILIQIIRQRRRKRERHVIAPIIETFKANEDKYDNWREDYMYIHVRNVFRKHLLEKKRKEEEDELKDIPLKKKILDFIRSKVYEIKEGFLYSTRIMVSSFVSILAVYTVVIYLCIAGYLVFYKYWRRVWFTSEFIDTFSKEVNINKYVIKKYVVWVAGCWWFAIAITSIFYVLVFMNSMTWYRRHVLKLRAGDRSFLPSSISKGSLNCGTLMNACIKYAGFQIAYSTWGFFITFFVFWLILVLSTTLVLIPLIYGTPSFVITFIKDYWITMLVGISTVIIQSQLVKICFLIETDSTALDNRRAFHVTSYIMFYFNIFRGLFSCVLRIGYGVILGIVFLQRLQKSTLPRSYERKDPGYLAYLGFLLIEHQHSNPTLQCFVRILLETVHKNLKQNDVFIYGKGSTFRPFGRSAVSTDITDTVNISMEEIEYSDVFERNRKIRTRNRWFLFLLLAQNPSLIKYRARYFKRRYTNKFLTKMIKKVPVGEFEVDAEVSVETVERLLTESRQIHLEPIPEDNSKLQKIKVGVQHKLKRLKEKHHNKDLNVVEDNNTEDGQSEESDKEESNTDTVQNLRDDTPKLQSR